MSKKRCFFDVNAEGKRLGRIVCEVLNICIVCNLLDIVQYQFCINVTCKENLICDFVLFSCTVT